MDRSNQDEVVEFLADPQSYSGAACRVERFETHGALVFLAGDDAWKIKRAVKFPYMDFSTREKRRRACERELEINRNFAPEIYLACVPITRERNGHLALGGSGDTVEWSVRMRRFDQAALLSNIAARDAISSDLTFGATRLLLAVVAIDTLRNIIENLYFGVYFGAQYGLFSAAVIGVLGNPNFLIIPKLINVAAAGAVLGLLLLRWLLMASQERAAADEDLRETSDALMQEAEERRQLFKTSLDLILITDRVGTLVRVSPSSALTLGYSPEEMTGRSAAEFVYPADLEATRTEMRLARAGRHTRNFETRYVHKQGRIVALAWSGVWSEPEQKHFFVGRDMTERKVAEEQLRQLAHYDQLTGLVNRVTRRKDLNELLTRTGPEDRATAIAMFDLDGFKDINDTLGHSTGDRLLQDVAQRLTETAKESGQVRQVGDSARSKGRRSPGENRRPDVVTWRMRGILTRRDRGEVAGV